MYFFIEKLEKLFLRFNNFSAILEAFIIQSSISSLFRTFLYKLLTLYAQKIQLTVMAKIVFQFNDCDTIYLKMRHIVIKSEL